MTLPDFLYIGPPRSASTWLYEVLRAHPRVFVPRGKDIYFFDRYFARGQDWYEARFAGADRGHLAVGDISHDYLYSALAATRIRATIPGARLLAMLRNPFDRALSDYRYVAQWSAGRVSFAQALDRHPTIISNGLYAGPLGVYFDLFGRERVHVMIYDDLRDDPERVARGMLEFLGVGFCEGLPVHGRANVSAESRAPWLTALARRLAQRARDMGFSEAVGRLKYSPLRRALFRPATAPPPVDEESLARMRESFLPDIDALEALIGRDLSGWKAQGGRAARTA